MNYLFKFYTFTYLNSNPNITWSDPVELTLTQKVKFTPVNDRKVTKTPGSKSWEESYNTHK